MSTSQIRKVVQWTKYAKEDGKCFFCNNDKRGKFYSPSRSMVADYGPQGEMVVYEVCAACWQRCNNKDNLKHDDRLKYMEGVLLKSQLRAAMRDLPRQKSKAKNPMIEEVFHTAGVCYFCSDEEGRSMLTVGNSQYHVCKLCYHRGYANAKMSNEGLIAKLIELGARPRRM
jgi:hypothetical protein